jgi:hypothetical protein
MKKTGCGIIKIFLIILMFIFIYSCKKDKETVRIEKLSGYAQKGPFIIGTTVNMYELNSSLEQTGKVFTTQISDDKGSFEINNVTLSSKYVEFSANGYYWNEEAGGIPAAPFTLNAISNLSDKTSVNVNVLTHIEINRVKYLVSHGKRFSEAKDSARTEIMRIFGFKNYISTSSEDLDISSGNQGDAILLAISLILQGNRNVPDLTSLLANIANDITQDGMLDSETIMSGLQLSTKDLIPEKIRSNLEKRYQGLGVSASIPGFEEYLNMFAALAPEKPAAFNAFVTKKTSTSVNLNGSVNPNSLSTMVSFDYGTSTSYGSTATAAQSPVTGFRFVDVNASISGLTQNTTYHYRVKATNSLGSAYSTDWQFTTLSQAP